MNATFLNVTYAVQAPVVESKKDKGDKKDKDKEREKERVAAEKEAERQRERDRATAAALKSQVSRPCSPSSGCFVTLLLRHPFLCIVALRNGVLINCCVIHSCLWQFLEASFVLVKT
jgi:hypothetical protein